MTGTDDVKIIEGVIQCYLDGLYESDAGKIASVFHPTSALTSVTGDGELVIPPRFFTDQLSLLKIDGSWQIAQKVFSTEMRE
jgi:hypothetical protein